MLFHIREQWRECTRSLLQFLHLFPGLLLNSRSLSSILFIESICCLMASNFLASVVGLSAINSITFSISLSKENFSFSISLSDCTGRARSRCSGTSASFARFLFQKDMIRTNSQSSSNNIQYRCRLPWQFARALFARRLNDIS